MVFLTTGLYNDGDFFVGIPSKAITGLQGAVGDTLDQAVYDLASMCVIPGLSVLSSFDRVEACTCGVAFHRLRRYCCRFQ